MDIRKLNFSYQKKILFSDFCYTFEKNKIYLLMGKNGSGKTTLLKLISHLYPNSLKKEKTFLIFDSYQLPGHLKVSRFLSFFTKNQERMNEYLKKFSLPDILIKNLSQGMKQKIQMILVFLIEDQNLLFDEIESYVDKETIQLFIREIKKIDLKNRFILISTHHFNYYKGICDHICLLGA